MKNTILPVFLLSLFLFSCNEKSKQLKDGVYYGTFSITAEDTTISGIVNLELKNKKFTCSSNPNRIPAGGSGKFTHTKNTITFNDENFWTADFNWNQILDGEYNYTFDGKNLQIEADKNDSGKYTYDLTKH